MTIKCAYESSKGVVALKPQLIQGTDKRVESDAYVIDGDFESITAQAVFADWGDTGAGGFEVGLIRSLDGGSTWEDVPNDYIRKSVVAGLVTNGQTTGVFAKPTVVADFPAVYDCGYVGKNIGENASGEEVQVQLKIVFVAVGTNSTGTLASATFQLADAKYAPVDK